MAVLLFAALFSPVWLGGGLLGTTDAILYYYPSYVTRQFGWTSLLYSGYPVQGDPQSMFWYPVALLGSAIPGSWNAFVISGYVLAASFAYGYAYRITRSRLGAAVAGITYGMSGFAIAHLDHVSMLHAIAWLPLWIWALEELRRAEAVFWLPIGAGAIGLCQRGDLNRISQLRACAVGLHVPDCLRLNTSVCHRLGNHLRLSGNTWSRRSNLERTVVVCRPSPDYAVDAVTVGDRVAKALEHHNAHTAAEDGSV